MTALKKRLIPVLLLKNGLLVRSEGFNTHQIIGNPINEVERFNEWDVDELIYIDITREGDYCSRRSDLKVKHLDDPISILREVSRNCFMPLTWGGGIHTIEQVSQCFLNGADKITLNSAAVSKPEFITNVASLYGSQAIVISIDVILKNKNKYEVMINNGKNHTGLNPVSWAKEVEKRGAGEIFLQSVDRDGAGEGYDLELIAMVSSAVNIPVIACSGAGTFDDYADAINAGASAAAAANIWHFKALSDRMGKRAMLQANINVRI